MFNIIWIVLSLFLTGCGKKQENKQAYWVDNGKIKVLSSIAMIDDLVHDIGGDFVDTTFLITGELDPHSYELVRGDDEKFERADLIFYNGLGLEHGLSLRKKLENNQKAIALGDLIFERKITRVIINDDQVDPHIWLDMNLWAESIDFIVEALLKKDPSHEIYYKERGEALKRTILAFDEEAYEMIQSIPEEKRYIVTSHLAFDYFARRYLAKPEELENGTWRDRASAPEGLSPESQVAFSDIEKILDHMGMHKIEVLFGEANMNRDSLEKIKSSALSKNMNLRFSENDLHADAMGEKSYIAMMRHNIDAIYKELK